MYYTLTSAYGVLLSQSGSWSTLSLASTPVNVIFQTYRKVYLTISIPSSTTPLYVDMDSLRNTYSAYSDTLQNLLTSFGSNSLVTISSIPTPNTKTVIYQDAFRAGYKVELVNNNNIIIPNAPASQLTRVRLSRPNPNTDMNVFYQNALVSINGYFFQTATDGNYTYVLGAGTSWNKSKQNQVGVHSFYNLGGVQILPITQSMIYSQGTGSFLNQRAYINLNVDLTGKTVILVLGGYLNFQDSGSFFQTANSSFCIDFNRIPMLDRYYESLPYIDYSSLGLSTTTNNPTQISLQQFFSDSVLINYLTMTNSFIAIVNTPELFVSKTTLNKSRIPGVYLAYNDPILPMALSSGRVVEYWKEYDDQQWSLNVVDSLQNNRIFDTADKHNFTSVSNQRTPFKTGENSAAYLLEIGKDF